MKQHESIYIYVCIYKSYIVAQLVTVCVLPADVLDFNSFTVTFFIYPVVFFILCSCDHWLDGPFLAVVCII